MPPSLRSRFAAISNALESTCIGPDRKMTCNTVKPMNPFVDPNWSNFQKCHLPIPFVKGNPIDYQSMTVEQLKKFINFMYTCQYQKPLAGAANAPSPSWWPSRITFDKNLKLKQAAQRTKEHQKLLAELLRNCYEFSGLSSLLALGRGLSDINKLVQYEQFETNCIKVKDLSGKIIVLIDSQTRLYDSPISSRVLSTKPSSSNNDATRRQNSKAKQVSAKKGKPGKRKLFEVEPAPDEFFSCKYCQLDFRFTEFCEEHEVQCEKGPKRSAPSQMGFMNALGLLTKSQASEYKTEIPKCRRSSEESLLPVGRHLRKLPKRNQLLSVVKNNPIPLSSKIGQKFVSELGEAVKHVYPTENDRFLKPASGHRMPDGKFPVVTKKFILKDVDNAHVYSLGRRQRMDRYQELVVGVNKKSWKVLNTCKPARLVLPKLHRKTKSLQITQSSCRKSYLRRAFHAAIEFPRIKLIDVLKHPTSETEKYLKSAVAKSK